MVIYKLSKFKSIYNFNIQKIPLSEMPEWKISDEEIFREDNKHFKVIATSVEIEKREVTNWTQPMIEATQYGLFAFLIKKEAGIIYFLVRIRFEVGNYDYFELAPTVQCSPENYKRNENVFLDYVLNARKKQIIISSVQSEEGGRFFREENKYVIIQIENDFNYEIPEDYEWMTLLQLKSFIKYNNYVNIQARSLLSMIDFNQIIND